MKMFAFAFAVLFFAPSAFAGLCENAQTQMEIHECLITELAQKDDRLVEVLKARGGKHDITVYQKNRLASCQRKNSLSAGQPVYGSALLECLIEDTNKQIDRLESR